MSELSPPPLQLSVIIPTCNRPSSLAACLSGLQEQTLPSSALEVVVVDDSGQSSSANTEPTVAGFRQLTLIRHEQNLGAAAARNTGARAASGDYLAFVDDDCVPDRSWAAELTDHLADSGEAALVGTVRVDDPQSGYDRVTQLLSEPLQDGDGTLVRAQTANLTVPAAAFAAVGGFDESYSGAGYEDYEFCQRWRASGRKILAVPEAIVHHRRNTTLTGFWRQHYHYGLGAARFYGQGPEGPHPPLRASVRRMLQTVGAGRTLAEKVEHLGWVGLSQCAMLTGFAAGKLTRE